MSSQQPKPSSYINITADVNFLQRIICCNHDIGNAPTPADTPRSKSLVEEIHQVFTPNLQETELDIKPD